MMTWQKGDQHWSRRRPDRVARGAAHPCSKLKEAQIEELRDLSADYGPSALARYFGVSRMTIWRHLRRVTCDVPRGTGGDL